MAALSFYIHYNGTIPEKDHTLFEMFISHFSNDKLNFKTEDTSRKVFRLTLKYLNKHNKNEDENFCGSKERGVPGMHLDYLIDLMLEPNNATLISHSIDENGKFKPMAILVFKNGNSTDELNQNLYLDGMCSDQQSPIRGMGSQLLSIFINAATEVGFQFIELASASKKATETWKNKGFKRDQLKRKDYGNLPIYLLNLQEKKTKMEEQKGGEGDIHVRIDLKNNNNILVCDDRCENLGPLLPEKIDSLDDIINNYINKKFEANKKGGKKHKTKKYKTRKYRTRRYKTKKYRTRRYKRR